MEFRENPRVLPSTRYEIQRNGHANLNGLQNAPAQKRHPPTLNLMKVIFKIKVVAEWHKFKIAKHKTHTIDWYSVHVGP